MFISDFAIERPIVTVTAMLALVAFGIAALVNLHTDEFPDIQQPIVGVTILYPGASPETVEREIVDPIEESFSSISGRGLEQDPGERHRRPGAVHRVLRFREGHPGGVAGHPRRDLHQAGRPAHRDGGAGPHPVRSLAAVGAVAGAHLVDHPDRHADPDRRPDDRPRAPRRARRGAGDRWSAGSSGS